MAAVRALAHGLNYPGILVRFPSAGRYTTHAHNNAHTLQKRQPFISSPTCFGFVDDHLQGNV